jgi:multicomponent Na+:H+ antiporter subunit F
VISDLVFYVGIVWLAGLLGVVVVRLARAASPGERLLSLDLLTLVLIGLLAVAAGEDRRSYALDAALALALLSFLATLVACRYYENREPFS